MPDGVEIEHWGFDDGSDTKPLPSPQIRVMEGEVAQVTLTTGKRVHTIHHHGIEPDPFNDGVGHSTCCLVRSTRNACCASKAAASGWGVVNTVTSPAGSRRHSSQRYDWMPPILGGKSLVTSR